MSEQQLFVKMVLHAWDLNLRRTDKLISELTDLQLQTDIAPGRNSGVYLVGHLVAIHDYIFEVLGLGQRMYPELEEAFISKPDKSGVAMPAAAQLREYWTAVHDKLSQQFSTLSAAQWFERHTSISAEDFVKEPHRNRLSVLITRTNHLSYHYGQIALLKAKTD